MRRNRNANANVLSICCSPGSPGFSLNRRINMTELQYTLLSDGSTDRVLMPMLTWLLHEHLPNCAVQRDWADLRRLPKPPKTLHERFRSL